VWAAWTVEHVLVLDSNFLNALDAHPQVLHVVIPLHTQLWKVAQTRGRGGAGGGGEHADTSTDMHPARWHGRGACDAVGNFDASALQALTCGR
jgi:hypothetical protein